MQFGNRAQWHVEATPKTKQNDWADHLRGATIVLYKRYPLRRGLCTAYDGKIPDAGNQLVLPAFLLLHPDVRLVKKGIEADCGTDAPGSYIAWLCTQVPVYAMEMPSNRYDIGNLESYETVQKTYKGITA